MLITITTQMMKSIIKNIRTYAHIHFKPFVTLMYNIYKQFLLPIVDSVVKMLGPPSNILGLDYGCGPGPTLSLMFKEQGTANTMFMHNAHGICKLKPSLLAYTHEHTNMHIF